MHADHAALRTHVAIPSQCRALLDRDSPFVFGSLMRLAALSALAIVVALVFGSAPWSVLIGVAAAQVVMVAMSVRQGLRA